MHRSKRLVVVAHCLLNANAKVFPLASYPGILNEAIQPFLDQGAGLVQLPCPETYYLGLSRFGMTREQYDTPAYVRCCETLLQPVVIQLQAFARAGYDIDGVVGMDGSPSCGVSQTCLGFCGGEISASECDIPGQIRALRFVPGAGVFMDVLRRMLDEAGLQVPFMAVDEQSPGQIISRNP